MPSVVIFRDRLLPLSETFIPSQVESLSKFRGVYAGCRRVPGLDLSASPSVVLGDEVLGWIEEFSLKRVGWAPRLIARLKEYQPVLLHAHFGTDSTMALPLARKLKIPMLVTFHGYDASLDDQAFKQLRWGRRYLRNRDTLKRDATGFLAVSKFIAQRLVAQGFAPEKTQVHYIGVDTAAFKPNPNIRRERTVLFVGRLVEKKGCEYLIRAMEPIQKEMPDVELLIIGDGPLRANLEQQARLSLRRYRFLGPQPADAVRKWMHSATVLCVPSVTAQNGDSEGFGMVFAEAQACGTPVASFMSGGIPEAVAHGE